MCAERERERERESTAFLETAQPPARAGTNWTFGLMGLIDVSIFFSVARSTWFSFIFSIS